MANKKLSYLLLLGLIFFYNCSETSTSSEDPDADPNGEEELLLALGADETAGKIKVMSRNLYIGTDVTNLLDEVSLIQQIPSAVRNAFYLLENTNFIENLTINDKPIEILPGDSITIAASLISGNNRDISTSLSWIE